MGAVITSSDARERALSSYAFTVSPDHIAQHPASRRDHSRLMHLDPSSGSVTHHCFSDLPVLLRSGDCLVVNRTRVVPARIAGRKETGGRVEALFLDPFSQGARGLFRALLRPGQRPGTVIRFPAGLTAVVSGRAPDGSVMLACSGTPVCAALERRGIMPLPPYIRRTAATACVRARDRRRYQTVYARSNGSVAAPTAGLHFTASVFRRLAAAGVAVAEVVLHVGWGTFKPVTAESIDDHEMLPEDFEVDAAACRIINRSRAGRGRVIAVGTTAARALESAAAAAGPGRGLAPARGATSLFIRPGYRFRAIDGLLTNFHQPCSTPLLMASALSGRARLLDAYRIAAERDYRFFSYGDSMLIV